MMMMMMMKKKKKMMMKKKKKKKKKKMMMTMMKKKMMMMVTKKNKEKKKKMMMKMMKKKTNYPTFECIYLNTYFYLIFLEGQFLPCLDKDSVIRNLRKRFRLEWNSEQIRELVNNLIVEARDNWRTNIYDTYQRILNDIY
jgi:hypothetical protein